MKDDSQTPNPLRSSFEVPDLELNRELNPARKQQEPVRASACAGTRLFEADTDAKAPTLELDLDPERPVRSVVFGSAFDLDDPSSIDGAPTSGSYGHERELSWQQEPIGDERAAWPSGRALDPERLEFKVADIQKLADYGPIPSDVRSTPRYAYRVYKRRRRLQQSLAEASAERVRNDAEREAALAELAALILPALQDQVQFREPLATLRKSEAALRSRLGPAVDIQLALAELGRTILAHRGLVEVSNEQLRSVRRACVQADASRELEERLRRALGSYDATRVRQGVRLSCTLAALLLLLIAMNYAF